MDAGRVKEVSGPSAEKRRQLLTVVIALTRTPLCHAPRVPSRYCRDGRTETPARELRGEGEKAETVPTRVKELSD
jgi:hypothetical protein